MPNISVKLPRLLAIILYDLIIIIAILLFATTILFFICLLLRINPPDPHSIYFRLYLASFILSYYHISWTYLKHGQTIGMKAWGVKLVNNNAKLNSRPISILKSILKSILRITGGILGLLLFGLGYIALYFNKSHQSLADYLSRTRLYLIKNN